MEVVAMPSQDAEARKAARAAYMKAWRAKNKNHISTYNHAYHEAHADERHAYKKEYAAEHKEELYEKKKIYRAANPEKVKSWDKARRDRNNADPVKRNTILHYHRTYHQDHRDTANALRQTRFHAAYHADLEATHAKDRAKRVRRGTALAAYFRAYYARNLAAGRARQAVNTHMRRARLAAVPAAFTMADAAFMRRYFGYACAACGRQEGFEWIIANDHWIPLSDPACPGTVPTNMIPLCHGIGGCNNTKNKANPLLWLRRRFGPRKAASIQRKIEAYFALLRERT
jgi:hypothetical protein